MTATFVGTPLLLDLLTRGRLFKTQSLHLPVDKCLNVRTIVRKDDLYILYFSTTKISKSPDIVITLISTIHTLQQAISFSLCRNHCKYAYLRICAIEVKGVLLSHISDHGHTFDLASLNFESTQILDSPESREAMNHELDKLEFLGSVTCSHTLLTAGSVEEIVIDYEVGASGITDSGGIKVCFKFYSDWELQTSRPEGRDFCSVEYRTGSLIGGASPEGSATLRRLLWRYDQKGGERPFQKAIIIDLADGYLRPGDHIIIRLGDRRGGGPGTRVQTFVEDGFCFRFLVDPLGTQRYARGPDLNFDILAGKPSQILVTSPRITTKDSPARVAVHLEDEWGNPVGDVGGIVQLRATGALNVEHLLSFPEQGWATVDAILTVVDDGEVRLDATIDGMGLESAPAFLETVEVTAGDRAWFGDLHIHTNDTVGTNDNQYNFAYAKDVARLDFMGYTANDFQITDERWERVVELSEKFTEPGSFVCFPGVEWCGTPGVGGDHNVVFIGEDTTLARCLEWHEEMGAGRPEPQAWPISRLYEAYEHRPEDYLLIPHVGGRRAVLDWHHPQLERLIEVHSAWGPDPWFFEDAMRRGLKVGASGASDEHRGRPGGGHPGANIFGSRGGLCGVLSPSLDRPNIGRSLRARHTWATTGPRLVALAWVDATGSVQGDCIDHDPSTDGSDVTLTVSYLLLGDVGWESVSAYDGAGLLWTRQLDEELGYGSGAVRLRWGGARVKDRYRWTTWTGQLRVTGSSIDSVAPWGFQHNEHHLWRSPQDPSQVEWSGRTYGDSQGAVLQLRNLSAARFNIEADVDDPDLPHLHWDVSAEELIKSGRLNREVGGLNLFASLERLSDAELPRRVEGTFTVRADGPGACVYLRGRQRDGHETWTSPIFVNWP